MKRFLPTLNFNPKVLNLLFWVGLGVMIAGLSASIIAGAFSNLDVGLVIAGLVLILLWLILRWLNTPPSQTAWWQQRSLQSGTNALLTTIAMLVILGCINFLAFRTPQQIDFTEVKQFSLAPQTKQVLKDLKKPVKAFVFSSPPDPTQQSLLEQYQLQNRQKFSFEFIDPQSQPGIAQKYKIRTLGEVILDAGDRTKTVEGALTETSLTPAIASLMRDRKINAYILQGHGEIPLTGDKVNLDGLVSELKKRDFNVNPLNLLEQPQIPEDADVIVVPGPKRDLLPAEVQRLQDYLNQGKSVLLMLDPDPENRPNVTKGLEPLLKDWGIKLDGRLVVDSSGAGQQLGLGPVIPVITQYGAHPITKDFEQGPSFFPLAQAIDVKPPAEALVTELLQTNPATWAEGDLKQEKLEFNEARDRKSPLSLGVAITRKIDPASVAPKTDPQPTASPSATPTESPTESPSATASPSPSATPTESPSPSPSATPSTETKREAKLVVIGDSDFATVANPQVLNGDFFLNSVTWLGSGQDDPNLSIRPKEPKDRRLTMSLSTWRTVILLGLVFLPMAGFGSAAYLWWKRR